MDVRNLGYRYVEVGPIDAGRTVDVLGDGEVADRWSVAAGSGGTGYSGPSSSKMVS
jgi:hypothetical protein